jgi:tetratricopeptide (TPR) repeat protein
LVLKAQYEAAVSTNSSNKDTLDEIYNTMKSHASNNPTNGTVQLCTAQVAIMNHETQYAYQLLASTNSNNVDCIALKIQLLLKIDRIDLAQKELHTLQRLVGEDHVLVELCIIYIALSIGTSQANDAEHRLITLCEQYGPSIYLLNLLSVAYSIQGNYVAAEQKLQECLRDFNTEMTISQKVDTYLNLLCIYHQQPNTKTTDATNLLNELISMYNNSTTTSSSSSCSSLQQFHTNYERVVSAYDREAIRYMTN